jgi:hypothetical protein
LLEALEGEDAPDKEAEEAAPATQAASGRRRGGSCGLGRGSSRPRKSGRSSSGGSTNSGRTTTRRRRALQEQFENEHKADQEAVPAAEGGQELREEVAEGAEEAYSSWQD